MAALTLVAETDNSNNSDFRRKFVDEENYIDSVEWHEYKSSTFHVRGGGKGETFRKGDGGGGRALGPTKTKTIEPSERSEDCEPGGDQVRAASRHAPTRRVNLEAMRAGAERARKQRRANNDASRKAVKLRLVKTPIDWSKLDVLGNPAVSFDPFSPERDEMVEILKRDSRDRTRQAIVRKLGVEFSRIYERYRKDAERRRSGISWYEIQDRERKSCEDAAIMCILRGVTPRQLLEYWDKNIKHYTTGNLTIPPLQFLKSASAVDRVAASALGTVSKVERTRKPDVSQMRPQTRNTFSGTDGLDVRLRPMLEAAGFKTQAYNDRYLLSVQHNALALANGKSIFLAEGRLRRMVHEAVKLYKGHADT